MNFDAFTIKMRGLIPTCTEAELSGWHDFAKENVNQGQLVDFADAEASGFDKRAAVCDWLETLYAKMALTKRRYGEDAVKLICSLGAAQSCLYPYEMDKAAAKSKRSEQKPSRDCSTATRPLCFPNQGTWKTRNRALSSAIFRTATRYSSTVKRTE